MMKRVRDKPFEQTDAAAGAVFGGGPAPGMDIVERVARRISEEDRAEANEASDFADWHWEERADLAREIVKLVREGK